MNRVVMMLLVSISLGMPMLTNAFEANDRVDMQVLLEDVNVKDHSDQNLFTRLLNKIIWKPIQHTLLPTDKRKSKPYESGWDMTPNQEGVHVKYHY